MTKDALVEAISSKCTKLPKTQIRECLDTTFDSIAKCLEKGDSISIIGFGTFSITHRKARKGINPKTMQPINIPATKMPKFKPSSKLKDRCK